MGKEKELFETPESPKDEHSIPVPEPVTETKAKKPRKKRVMTEEQREAMKANLAKGRATALANRQRKAQVKKIKKQTEVDEQEKLIVEHAKKKQSNKNANEELEKLRAELAAIKAERVSEKKQKPVKPVEVVEPPKKKEKKPVVVKEEQENHIVKEEKKEPQKVQKQDVQETPKPKQEAKPPQPPKMTHREMIRMMRGI